PQKCLKASASCYSAKVAERAEWAAIKRNAQIEHMDNANAIIDTSHEAISGSYRIPFEKERDDLRRGRSYRFNRRDFIGTRQNDVRDKWYPVRDRRNHLCDGNGFVCPQRNYFRSNRNIDRERHDVVRAGRTYF